MKHFNRGTSGDTENDEESILFPQARKKNLEKDKERDLNRNNDKDKTEQTEEDDDQRPWHALVSYVDEITLGGRRNSKGQYIDGMGSFPGFGKKKKPKVPADCFPPRCYNQCPILDRCIATEMGQKWSHLRRVVVSFVDTPTFEWFILVLIFASSVTLCFEDIHLDDNPQLKSVLYWTNLAFSIIFIIEMGLKWLALGFHKYFTSFWTLLDFLIVFVRIFIHVMLFSLQR